MYNKLYIEDVQRVAELELPWEQLENSTVLVTGAGGLLGSFLIDVIMERNRNYNCNCNIIAVGRNEKKAKERFKEYWGEEHFVFLVHDVNDSLEPVLNRSIDYMIHLASNTHPVAYASDPIGTITTNIIGTNNLLEYAVNHDCKRFVFASSNEIYGENRGDTEFFDENYCGYLNSNTMRAGYPESKRCAEALCQAYIKQKNMDIVIPRFTRSYGPTMLLTDTKAISQFLKKGVQKEDIVLKSEGTQYYSYTYMADAISGLFTVLLKGNCGEAYNIADEKSDIMLKDLAKIIADYAGKRVVFELPDELEKSGYSTATKARLDGNKIKQLGWKPKYDIKSGIERTLEVMSSIK